jgi:hypothetical protein
VKRRQIDLAAHPELVARVRMQPFKFEVGSRGALEVSLGDVHLHFDEIPIRLRVPFLSRRVLAGSVGPFGVRMEPVEGRIRCAEMVTEGVLGGEESGVDVRLDGACRATAEIVDDGCEEAE